jgi:hypothetical protein
MVIAATTAGHRQERGEASEKFGAQIGASFGEPKEAAERRS